MLPTAKAGRAEGSEPFRVVAIVGLEEEAKTGLAGTVHDGALLRRQFSFGRPPDCVVLALDLPSLDQKAEALELVDKLVKRHVRHGVKLLCSLFAEGIGGVCGLECGAQRSLSKDAAGCGVDGGSMHNANHSVKREYA